jgi:CheY-like chemotaxis protein
VDSVAAQGSCFWFEVPFTPGKSGERTWPLRVLVVDDSNISREIIVAMLESLGIAAEVAEHGAAAVAMAQHAPYDLIFMDLNMPTMDGTAATAAIRNLAFHRSTPIIALTATDDDKERLRCLAAGMNDYLVKPLDPEALTTLVGRWRSGPDVGRNRSDTKGRGRAPSPDIPACLAALGSSVDTAAGLSSLGGDADLYVRLVAQFCSSHRDTSETLRRQAMANDIQGLHRSAHTLLGLAATLGLFSLKAPAQALDVEPSPLLAEDLAAAMDQLIPALEQTLPQQQANTAANDLVDRFGDTLRRAFDEPGARLVAQIESFNYRAALETIETLKVAEFADEFKEKQK